MDDPRIKGAFIAAVVDRNRLEQLASWLADGSLRLPEIHTYKLDQVASAFKESEAGHVRGKLVITP
jgi:NADPH:quinone reductase-like Zn-dependent oxidoreductase